VLLTIHVRNRHYRACVADGPILGIETRVAEVRGVRADGLLEAALAHRPTGAAVPIAGHRRHPSATAAEDPVGQRGRCQRDQTLSVRPRGRDPALGLAELGATAVDEQTAAARCRAGGGGASRVAAAGVGA
jgi:hypothetical protein